MTRLNSLLAPATRLPVPDASAVGDVRRFCQAAAERLKFDPTRAGEVAIVATELATNLVRHAKGGDILARVDPDGRLDLLSIDRGPGMRDVERCLEDGFSTAGGPGNGLGAIRRLASVFDLHSDPGLGTVVLAGFGTAPAPRSRVAVGAFSIAYPGEPVCGDAWDVGVGADRAAFAVIDGLGHGSEAARATEEGLRALTKAESSAKRMLEAMHGAMRATRGAAASVAVVDFESRRIRYAGLGNVVGATVTPGTIKRMASFDGIAGSESPNIHEFDYALEPGQALILHSDGIRSQWKLETFPGLLARHPMVIAGVLYRDGYKGSDDATALVARVEAG
jgi:anti-sigma regulatory factor (Ser/Thr protein kinase)